MNAIVAQMLGEAKPALEPDLCEGRWHSLVAAGMLGTAAWHQGTAVHRAATSPVPAPHHLAQNPSKEPPSEKNLDAWGYAEKKDRERSNMAHALKPATRRYFNVGEADHHSPEELAQLKGAGHGEADLGNPEEAREVQIGKALKAAAGNPQEVLRLADELIMMHKAQQPP